MFVLASSYLIFDSRILVVFETICYALLGEFIQFCPLFWNCSKRIIQLHSFFITLKKRAKISFKELDNIFVNGRKEYVKFSWINSFSKLCLGYTRLSYSRFRISNKRKIHNTVQVNKFTCLKFLKIAECFVNELDLYLLRFREQSVASITNFSLQKKNSKKQFIGSKKFILRSVTR